MSKYKLNGLTAVVTGASSGIGRAVAEKLIVRYGCTVVGIGRDENKFRDFSEKLGENVSRFSYRLFDVGNREGWTELCTFLTTSGIRPDLLVNCAGILPSFSFYGENSDAELAVKTNFLSAVYSFETLGPLLKESVRPKIVNVGSSSSLCPFAGVAAYCASKAAIERFTECIALEKGIPAAIVMPGFTDTDVFRFQNFDAKSKTFFQKFSMTVDRMSDRLIKTIGKGTRRKIIGLDAHLMNFGYKFFPRLTPVLITKILKSVKSDAFQNITR